MEKKAGKQPYDIVLENLSSLQWGGVYHGLAGNFGDMWFHLGIQSQAPGWEANGLMITGLGTINRLKASSEAQEFVLKAMVSLHKLNTWVILRGRVDIWALTDAFEEAVRVLSLTTIDSARMEDTVKRGFPASDPLKHRLMV